MLTTKRYLESLPEEKQRQILGPADHDDPLRGLPVNRPCTVRGQSSEICGVICNCGPNGEPLACGYALGHDGEHSWSTLPSYI